MVDALRSQEERAHEQNDSRDSNALGSTGHKG